jgi:tripartite ATP-independent transporter DctM subunit
MFDLGTASVLIGAMLALVMLGVHIAIALGITSAIGIYMVTGRVGVVQAMLASTATEALRDFTFAVIPLFMLMGEFIGKSGAITDIYRSINRGLRRIPARLAVATILGNAVFSFVTGVSIASAAAFSRISFPEMKAFGYHKGFALGAVAGSSCLGMLIPPSVLMIVWGILTERSIGQLFLAGVLPGLLMMSLFVIYVVVMAIARPDLVGEGARPSPAGAQASDAVPARLGVDDAPRSPLDVALSVFGIITIVSGVLGGIWLGLFTPTEGAGAGAFIALLLAFAKGMRGRAMVDAIFSVGRTSAPILLLLLAAALYSRTLAMTGITNAVQDFILSTGLSAFMVLGCMVIVWFVLGMVIDSISIMLLTVPIFEPLAVSLGFDPIAFAIVGILAIEAGLLTPPFGLLVYTVKVAIADDSVTIPQIFASSAPYWLMMLIGMSMIAVFPEIATFLPALIF